jgi:hypothetical protein
MKKDTDFQNLDASKKIIFYIFGLTPFNIPAILLALTAYFWSQFLKKFILKTIPNFLDDLWSGVINQPIRERRKRKRLIKEKLKRDKKIREDKIKRGVIRISPLDPYGEEDWIEDDLKPLPKRGLPHFRGIPNFEWNNNEWYDV